MKPCPVCKEEHTDDSTGYCGELGLIGCSYEGCPAIFATSDDARRHEHYYHTTERESGQSTLPAILAALFVAGLLFASVELGAARVAAALFAVGY